MMEPDYGYAQAAQAKCDKKPLEGLGSIAEEAERTAELISAFITRFRHGSDPIGGNNAATLKPVPSGHAGQIERLRDAVGSLDKLARDLNTLG